MKNKNSIVISLLLILIAASGMFFINNFYSDDSSTVPAGNTEQLAEKKSASPANEKAEQQDADKDQEENSTDYDYEDAVASVAEEKNTTFVRQNKKIVALGDSLTQGVGDPEDNGGYVGLLEEALSENEDNPSIEIENYGKRGSRSDQLINRLEEPAVSESVEEADIILITIGANDIMEIVKSNFKNLTYDAFSDETNDYESRIAQLFAAIRSKNEDAHIHLIGFYNPFNEYFSQIPELNQIVEEWNTIGEEQVSQDENASFIPTYDLFKLADERYYSEDNFHPNLRGYALMAERILPYLEEEMYSQQETTAVDEVTNSQND
ncbi:SGNH/GDSL hydrolase family protein [Alteribacillus sp. HJP-4]|uniref:SGNH/GDSL hydrolase family protein n=1 Tax=Alteribacillus sp. HJP-4 TaxID=2775394 RepID=UPI0035CCFFD8